MQENVIIGSIQLHREDAKPRRPGPKPKQYTLWGEVIQGLEQVAKRAGLPEKFLRKNAKLLLVGDITVEIERLRSEYVVGRRGPAPAVYRCGGERLDVTTLVARTGLPERTLRAWLANAHEDEDIKPALDELLNRRATKAADPHREGNCLKMVYRGVEYASKLELAQVLSAEYTVPLKTAQKFLTYRGEPGVEVEPTVNAWREAAERRRLVTKMVAAGVPDYLAWAAVGRGEDPDSVIAREAHAPKHRGRDEARACIHWTPEELRARFAACEHASGKLANVIIDTAIPVRTAGETTWYVEGLVCRHHGALASRPEISKLLRGVQPCPACSKEQRRASYPKTKGERTIAVLRKILASSDRYRLSTDARLWKAGEAGRKGSDHYVEGLQCVCGEPLTLCAWTSVVRDDVPCPMCRAVAKQRDLRTRLQAVHHGALELVAYGGSQNSKSQFRCTHRWCGGTWTTSVNAVLGRGGVPPTGCPHCNRPGRTEQVVGELLKARGIAITPQYPVPVVGGRDLRADYLLPERQIVIEVDGQQHYGVKDGWPAGKKKNFEIQRERDRAKCDALARDGITVCRIPHWTWDALEREIDLILAGTPRYVGTPDEVEEQVRREG